uniref:Coiled-coil domain-containing protein n=1 Tax=Myoviridae sp. ctsK93 TaxID=2825190 RepID=A0A8S5PJS4_9CAUD|nr:MAG TPA: coiled-coil domain-containing protein [Myoviridae sp. ctsK93]
MKVDNSIRVPFNVDVLKKIRQSQQKKMAYL